MAIFGRNDPCPCVSGRKWKHCCGAGTTKPFGAFVSVTGITTHHFFVVDPETGEMLRDDTGSVLVWTARALATAAGDARWPNRTVATVGMGDEKWEIFQRECRHVVVS